MSKITTNKVRVEMGREADKTYWVSVEDRSLKGDSRYVDGMSEGYETDPMRAAQCAGDIVRDWFIANIGKIA